LGAEHQPDLDPRELGMSTASVRSSFEVTATSPALPPTFGAAPGGDDEKSWSTRRRRSPRSRKRW